VEQVELWDSIDTTPILPYGGTSGWSGSQTSRQRVKTADSNGLTSTRQRVATRLLQDAGTYGLTWTELGQKMNLHHGSASGLLSVLHKTGVIERLDETRNRSQIYVLPEYVNDRTKSPYRPNVSARLLIEILNEIENDLANDDIYLARQRIRKTLETYEQDNG